MPGGCADEGTGEGAGGRMRGTMWQGKRKMQLGNQKIISQIMEPRPGRGSIPVTRAGRAYGLGEGGGGGSRGNGNM